MTIESKNKYTMDFAIPITNNLKKFVASLKSKKERESSKLFIAEGEKIVAEILLSNYLTEMVILKSNPKPEAVAIAEEFHRKKTPVYIARKQQFEQLCDTVSPQDIIAVVHSPDKQQIKSNSFIALDGINDPGNLGTIIRTADWFGFNKIILSADSADKFNSKTVRATMGSLFRLNIEQVEDLSLELSKNYVDYKIFAASLDGKEKLSDMAPKGKFGIVFGSEAHGISAKVLKEVDRHFIIPGYGGAESLNVAVSVGVSLYHFSKYIFIT